MKSKSSNLLASPTAAAASTSADASPFLGLSGLVVEGVGALSWLGVMICWVKAQLAQVTDASTAYH